ncbi:penicillin-binding protein 1A [Salinispirillum marinum]|uniref:Penicillin-binding protein 1A n=2 Tax=Saccharospirillaceae TaxID=255527 RepID=A0ABV8BEA9_9GAMM
MKWLKKTWYTVLWLVLTGLFGFATVCAAIYLYLAPTIPPVEVLKDVKLQTPLRIYSADNQLLAEIGEQRRTPITFDQIPELYVKALMAIEDHRFEVHYGVDPVRFASAVIDFVSSGDLGAGGSTLTQQVARSFFLNRDKTFTRKFTEIILAFKMEQVLTKAEIFELYSNQMYLGHRAYGAQAAARVYYNRDLNELTLPQLATIAGLHQLPSAANPISFPQRSLARRNTVLSRMHALGFITTEAYEAARATPITAERSSNLVAVSAPYVAEMARIEMVELFGEEVINEGYKVYTTARADYQRWAYDAVNKSLLDYEQRHGYTGPEGQHELPPEHNGEATELYQSIVNTYGFFGELEPAIVIAVDDEKAVAWGRYNGRIEIPLSAMTWARERITVDRFGPQIQSPADVVAEGDVIRLKRNPDNSWRFTQIPQAQSAFVVLNPNDGAIMALVGGFDYFLSSYNRVTQATRQPGSNFKPFVFSAALDRGFSASTIVNDAPLIVQDATLEGVWRPSNSGDRYLGPIPMREALYRSINVASVRLLSEIGVSYAAQYVSRFGLDPNQVQRNLGMVLGNSSFTPLDIARGYSVFANGGFLVSPYLIDRVEDANGNIVYESPRVVACADCAPDTPGVAERVLSPQTNYIMTDILRDTITRGTATAARSLNRNDIAGKTGTTNNAVDAWFSGFSPHLTGVAWTGYDNSTTLGFNEFGGRASLPIWIDFMSKALANKPDQGWSQPSGIVQVRIDPTTGQLALPGSSNAVFEIFKADMVPTAAPTPALPNNGAGIFGGGNSTDDAEEDLAPLF